MKNSVSLSKQLAFSALFAALCFIGTLLVTVPLPMGYFNVGDVFVLLAGWCLGPIYGAVAAGLGSALADIVSSYAFYAPFTFIIKGFVAIIAYMVSALLKKLFSAERLDFIPRTSSALLAETFMVAGYFVTETLFYGFSGAVGTLVGNVLQGTCCLILATLVFSLLYPIRRLRNLFPPLKNEE